MTTVRLTQFVEDSVALILPEQVLARLRWKAGDTVLLTETTGGFSLSNPDAEFEEQVRIGRKIMRERRDVLRALAKSDTRDPN